MSYKLPKLDYGYSQLEPYIDRETMRIHYTKHHQGYVNKLNAYFVDKGLKKIDLRELQGKIKSGDTALRNNGGGNFNHTLFWTFMTNKKKKRDINNYLPIANAILYTWGSMKDFYEEFSSKALNVFGSGWTWLIVDGKSKLKIVTTHNQDNPLMKRIKSIKHGVPILGLDVWEHAYYLKYQNKRGSYIDAFFHVINWEEVNKNYLKTVKR